MLKVNRDEDGDTSNLLKIIFVSSVSVGAGTTRTLKEFHSTLTLVAKPVIVGTPTFVLVTTVVPVVVVVVVVVAVVDVDVTTPLPLMKTETNEVLGPTTSPYVFPKT